MAQGLVEEQNLKNIAKAIREKNKKTDLYTPEQMSEEILKLKVLDTTDATATAGDVVDGKIAYVNEERVEGILPEATSLDIPSTKVNLSEKSNGDISITSRNVANIKLNINALVEVVITQKQIAELIGLTANKIKKDEIILGIKGTYEVE